MLYQSHIYQVMLVLIYPAASMNSLGRDVSCITAQSQVPSFLPWHPFIPFGLLLQVCTLVTPAFPVSLGFLHIRFLCWIPAHSQYLNTLLFFLLLLLCPNNCQQIVISEPDIPSGKKTGKLENQFEVTIQVHALVAMCMHLF